MKLFNASKSRTVTHEDNGQVYTIQPGSLLDVPDNIAENIIGSWKDVSSSGAAATNLPAEPWETRCGPTWELAQKEFKIDLTKQNVTVGPDRPEVFEAEVPADAIDPETGKVNEKLLNTHLCTYCQKEFNKIRGLRMHMTVAHNV